MPLGSNKSFYGTFLSISRKMDMLFFVAVASTVVWSSESQNNETSDLEGFYKRLEQLQEEVGVTCHRPNSSVDIFHCLPSHDLINSLHKIASDRLINNKTLAHNCQTNDEYTRCSQADIFEVVTTLPPTTEILEITDSPVRILNKPILRNLTRLDQLKLTNNSIQYVTSKLFTGLGSLRSLNLSDNRIRALLKVTFSHCPKLLSLDLSRNRIITLREIPLAFAPLKNLTFLSLSGNNLRLVKENDLAPLKDSPLVTLDLSYCMISYVGPGSFSHLGQLQKLMLKVTYLNEEGLANATFGLSSIQYLDLRLIAPLKAFPVQAIRNLANTSLEILDFSLNDFSLIPAGAFSQLPNMKYFRCASCLMSGIEDGAFDGLSSLDVLDLSQNRFLQVPSAISVLKNLVTLDLSNQKLRELEVFEIPDYSFSNLTSLTVLRLELNRIPGNIGRFSFHGLTSMTHLSLFSCEISTINRKAFETLSSLEFLELSYNNLFSLGNDTLYGLHNLKKLYARNNGLLIGYNSLPFLHTPSLEKLLLQGNIIKFLKPGLLSGLTKLREVNLTGNKIVPWNSSVLGENAPDKLYLEDNDISHVTPAMLGDFERVPHLSISSNPFDCRHCQMQEFRTWVLDTNASYSNGESPTYECHSPPELYGHSLLDGLQFDHCLPLPFAMEIRLVIGFCVLAVCLGIVMGLGYYFRWYVRYWWFHFHASVKRLSTSSNSSTYTYDAFVSYNSTDISWVVHKLIPNLENHNSDINLCLHDRDFEVGRLITENILESIDRSKKFLLVLTSSFVKSEWCLFELHVAQHRLFHDTRDALVLVQVGPLEKEELSKNLRYLMKTRTLLVWPEDPEKEDAFWTSLHKILSS